MKRETDRMFTIAISLLVALCVASCLQPLFSEICNTYLNVTLDSALVNYFVSDLNSYLGLEADSSVFVLAALSIIFLLSYMLCKKFLAKSQVIQQIEPRVMTEKRVDSVNVIKAVAVVLVIVVHTMFPIKFYDRPVNDPVMWGLIFGYHIELTCVPLFTCMTGFLMINKKLTWKHYVGWFKYGISFVLIMLVKPIYKYVQSGIAASFFQTLTVYYNGYMSMFFGIYILIPFLNTLWAQLKGHQKATLLFVLLFLCIVPSATGIAITSYWSPLCPFLYYYTGAILREYKVNLKNSTIAASVVGVCLLGTVYAIFFSEDILNMGFFWKVYNNYCNTYYTLPTYFLTVLIIIYFLNKTSYSPVVLKVLEKLAIHSLGIYLISSLYTQTTVWNVAGRYVELTDTTVLLIAPIVIVLEIVITYILSVVVERVSSLAYRKLMDRVAVKIGN